MKQEILDGREVRPMATAPRTKKDLKDEYKARALFGGVGAVKNQVNGMVLLESAVDILTKKNRFEFAKSSGNRKSSRSGNSRWTWSSLRALGRRNSARRPFIDQGMTEVLAA